VDVFDFYFRASDQSGNAEVIDEVIAVPMLFARARVAIGPVWWLGEAGYIEADGTGNSRNRFFDGETMLGWSLSGGGHLLAGYRFIDIDGTGETDAESFGVDLQLRGWFLGGGVVF
jgi:hypothetical protein